MNGVSLAAAMTIQSTQAQTDIARSLLQCQRY